MSDIYPLSRKDNIVVQELKGETLIYDLGIDRAFCLNQTSALIWELCDGHKSITEISQAVGKELKTPVSEELIWLALSQLEKENLIESKAAIPSEFNGLSRREVVKKVGFVSLVALPVIMSVTAPVAAQAVSTVCGTTLGNSCFCVDSYCDDVMNIGTRAPDTTCPDGCPILSGQPGCICRGIFICSSAGARLGVKTGMCS